MSRLRVLRVYHAAGVDAARERALVEAGVDLTVAMPASWPGAVDVDGVATRRLSIRRTGDVNRHAYADLADLARVLADVRPDLLDLHEEPVSLAARQWLRVAGDLPVVMYTAQNLDKRWPPPYARYEREALRRAAGFYPCSRQAASVLRGKGFRGIVRVLPLGVDRAFHVPGTQVLPAPEAVLGVVGRLVPEKGIGDAVRVLARVAADRPARLIVVGEGPEARRALQLAAELGVADQLEMRGWLQPAELGAAYRSMHVVLVPSRTTSRWVEQFGRVIVEAQANGAVPVGYATGSIAEVIGEGGVLVAEGDVHGMAAAVAGLLGEPERWLDVRSAMLRTPPASWAEVAAAQIELYDLARAARVGGIVSPSARTRAEAVGEFGPPACASTGTRPFAMPWVRDRQGVQRVLGGVVDALTGQR
jgi:glycosyltransferase involved in cell wall biosynthesis